APEDIRKKGKVPKNGSLFFTIFQTFMSGPPKDGKPSPYFGDYPPDFFDFVVIDECHRGGANDESNWRGILDYFAPAVQLGLTATPKRKDNVDTYKYFGEPVYVYSLREGINDGFLTPFKVKQISTTLDEYVYTSDDDVIEGEVEAGKRYVEAEFNKIIGRGTRLYDGKDYFTIYDFVKAHHHFSDSEWDGEPIEPEPKGPRPPPPPIPPGPGPIPPPPPKKKIKVKLADGKERIIQHMTATTFWSPDGKPMSAEEFLKNLYGKLPEFFKNEAELRTLWSEPATRKALLEGLAEKGYGRNQMAEMQKIIDAENSDLFDVLAYIAFHLAPISREERANRAKIEISTHFNSKQQVFLRFVLSQYVKVGVDELAQEKLTPLLRLKYNNAIADATAELGKPEHIRDLFAGFQKYLYQRVA